MGRKVDLNSKRQLKLKIKTKQDTIKTLYDMVHRRNKALKHMGVDIGMRGNEFLMGNEETLREVDNA